jgi:hypothetical protein
MTHVAGALRATVIVAASIALPALSLPAQQCDTLVSRTTASVLTGDRIRTVATVPHGPVVLPGAGRILSHLHVTSRDGTIRRDLRFAPGDTVDTLAVGESMRLLRQRPYLANAEIVGVRCGESRDVDLHVVTTDRWSLTPSFGAQANSSYGGVEERNLFGLGRQASISVASRQGKMGGAIGYGDPYLFALPVAARFRAARYADGAELRGRLRNAEQSPLDLWREQFTFSQYRQDAERIDRTLGVPVLVTQAFHREGAFLLVGRRLGEPTETSVSSVLFGAEFERASLNAPDKALTVGPKLVERRYHGPMIGFARRAIAFDTVSWLADRQSLVDVPLGLEMEGTLSGGREDVSKRGAGFGSLWVGRMWTPTAQHLVTLDYWTSGYHIAGRKNFDDASMRGLFGFYVRDHRTLYTLRAAAEKLVNPDPDVRALSTFDPTLPLIPNAYRLSENALAAEAERAQHIRWPIRAVGLDGAVFVASSLRTASALSQKDHFGVTAVGAGLRLVPNGTGSGTLRLDVLYPVLKNEAARHGFTFAVSVTPWLQANRQREDPRLRQ